MVANVYLEGTYSEIYPDVPRTRPGCAGCSASSRPRAASRATSACRRRAPSTRAASSATSWSTPSGPPSTTRDLIVAAVVGDGEAETGPLAGIWKGIDFLNPARDGAVLPILHLNGYKISGPDGAGPRRRRRDRAPRCCGHGYEPHFVEGDDPAGGAPPLRPHPRRAATTTIRAIQADARAAPASAGPPRWPAIVLRTPKGWTGPKWSTAYRSRARSAPTRCRWPA